MASGLIGMQESGRGGVGGHTEAVDPWLYKVMCVCVCIVRVGDKIDVVRIR